jgi:Tol biopolymer transport system component
VGAKRTYTTHADVPEEHMTKRVVLGALVGALMVVSTGCSEECADQFDCTREKGTPGQGKQWACVDNKCVTRDVTTPPEEETDAGTQMDAGTQTDAGTQMDAGTQTDAGTEVDAGTMTLQEGEACTNTTSCMAGLYCDGSGGSKTCQPLHIAVTRKLTGANTTEAVVVRYKTPGSNPATGTSDVTKLSEGTGQSRSPRWNKDGTAVAFVDASGNTVTLVTRNIPLVAAQKNELTTATAAGTSDFRYMEWAPSASIAWATQTGASVSGISTIPGAGGNVQTVTTAGVFPSWSADGSSLAYSSGGVGLLTRATGASSSTPVTGAPMQSEQPLHNAANNILLYLSVDTSKPAAEQTEQFGTDAVPLSQLYTIAASGGTPELIAATTEVDATNAAGPVRTYIANHTWSPGGTHVAYVRVFYVKTAAGGVICSGTADCGGRQGNVIYVRGIGTDGKPTGGELLLANEATLPSFSPDGRFIAYSSGGRLRVQRINPEATDEASLKVGDAIIHTWTGSTVSTGGGDDDRPRWQPRGP